METNDLTIWLQAAIPPTPKGRIDRARAATRLGISTRTLSRWTTDPTRIPATAYKRLRQLAILRGRGRILWPAPPADILDADQTLADYAARAMNDLAADRNTDFWNGPKQDRLQTHYLYVLRYPHAHVHSITIAQHKKSQARFKKAGAVIVERREYPNYWAAQHAKMSHLVTVRDQRCLVPARLVPIGRTHVWRDEGPTRATDQPTLPEELTWKGYV